MPEQVTPSHAIIVLGRIDHDAVSGQPTLIYPDGSRLPITRAVVENYSRPGELSYAMAMHAVMQGYRVMRRDWSMTVQYNAPRNEIFRSVGRMSYAAYIPVTEDMVTSDWLIVGEALAVQFDEANAEAVV